MIVKYDMLHKALTFHVVFSSSSRALDVRLVKRVSPVAAAADKYI